MKEMQAAATEGGEIKLSDGADAEAKGANYSRKRMAEEFTDKDKRHM